MADTDPETTVTPDADATPANDAAVNETQPPADDDALGEGGKAALEQERRARREAEKARKDAEKRAAEYEARLKEAADRDLSEKERAEKRAQELEEQLNSERSRARQQAVRYAVAKAASAHRFRDVEDAARFIDQAAIEFDDAGDPQNVDALVKAVATERPYLLDSTPPKDIESTPAPDDKGRDAASAAEKAKVYDRVFRRMNS